MRGNYIDLIGGNISIDILNTDQHTFDYLDCNSSGFAKQFVVSPKRHFYDYSSSSLIDHFCCSFGCEKLDISIVNCDLSGHMLLKCENVKWSQTM